MNRKIPEGLRRTRGFGNYEGRQPVIAGLPRAHCTAAAGTATIARDLRGEHSKISAESQKHAARIQPHFVFVNLFINKFCKRWH